MCTLPHGLDRCFCLGDLLLGLGLLGALNLAHGLAARVPEECPQDRADESGHGKQDGSEAHSQLPVRMAFTKRTPRYLTWPNHLES